MTKLTEQEKARRQADRLFTAAEHISHARTIMKKEAGNEDALYKALFDCEAKLSGLASRHYLRAKSEVKE